MDWFEALILGLIQGLTEYLPVSSSGHLAIGSALFGIQGEDNLAFTIVVHVATVFSTLVVLWKEIEWIFRGLFKWKMNEETRYIINILISMIPVGIVGVFFKEEVEMIFGSVLSVAARFVTELFLLLQAETERQDFHERCVHHRFGAGLCCVAGAFTFGQYHCHRLAFGR